MRKKVSALFRTCVLVAFAPALALSLVACEPEDNEPDTEVVETEGKGDDTTGSDRPESDAEGEGSTPGADAGEESGSPEEPVAIDLGLSVKWASCNVGASSPEGYGDYFAWGETTTKSSYPASNSVTYLLTNSELKSRGIIGAEGNLAASYDTATANWGSDWRMPTSDEMKELINQCTWEWTTMNGVNGYKVKSHTNGNSIFLPAAGYRDGMPPLYRAGTRGYYWSATPDSYAIHAYHLFFASTVYERSGTSRYFGHSVRPVTDK